MRSFVVALCMLAVGASACARATPEQQIVNDAADALGGRDRVLAVKTLVLEGGGVNGNLGQDMTPEATEQTFTLTGYSRAIDIGAKRMRVEQTRTPNFPYFQGQQPQRQVQGLDGNVAYNIAPDGTATRAAEAVATARTIELRHHPITIVRAALDESTKLTNAHTAGTQRVVDITTADGQVLTLAIDGATSLPVRVVSMAHNANLGDVAIETTFADFRDSGGLKLPARLTTKTDQVMTVDLTLTKQTASESGATPDPATLIAPPAAVAPLPATPPPTVTVEQLAPGVWLLAGQSHHSVVVEFADHLTLIEAPQSEARALAVIARARELKPAKPLTEVVVTHHHFDHSGGVRAAMSEGLAVFAHEQSATFFEALTSRPFTIAPDALAKRPQAVTIRPIPDETTLEDASRKLVLYHIVGSPHADTLLMAYFPKERLIVEADVAAPTVGPYTANFLENVKRRSLGVDRIVPIHGTVFRYADLAKAFAAAPKP